MRFHGIGGKKAYRVTIPKLNGGLNGHDAADQIDDNQLTDCLNMWWKDGALRTRPGMHPLLDGREDVGVQSVRTVGGGKEKLTEDGKSLRKRLALYEIPESTITPALLTTDTDGNTVKSVIRADMDVMTCGSSMLLENCGQNYDGMKPNGAIAFISPLVLESGKYLLLGEPENPAGEWVDLSGQVYAPLIMINGRGVEQGADTAGTAAEGFNLLTGAFRCQFTSDGQSYTFALPLKNLTSGAGETTTVRGYSVQGRELLWTIPPFDGNAGQSENSQVVSEADGKAVFVSFDKQLGRIQFLTAPSAYYPYPDLKSTNNIEVAAWKTFSQNKRKIFHMQFCTWFGGTRSGYNGGTRLFVSGNPELSNAVYWSDLNNPLYFPENNYAYIGNAGSEVTAFAKQEDKLIIFKTNEIYSAQYAAGQSYSAGDLTESKGTDMTAVSAYFPITPIHPGIGCDCPDTILLCDNRLVWASSDRSVYALSGSNPFSETNVRTVSRNIDGCLASKRIPEMRAAHAVEYSGHYALLVGNDMFLLDYQDGNFLSYMSDLSSRKPQSSLSWTRWNFDGGLTLDDVTADGDSMVLCGGLSAGGTLSRLNAVLADGEDQKAVYADSAYSVQSSPVSCLLQTKTFQFSEPEHRKDIRRLFIGMSMDDNASVRATYLTETGETQDAAPIKKIAGGAVYRLTPNAVRVQRFGMRMNSDGVIAVQDIVLNYDVYERGIRS